MTSRRAAAVLAERRTQEELAAAPEGADEGEEHDASFELTDADADAQKKKQTKRKGPGLLGKRGAAGGIALSDDEDEDEDGKKSATAADETAASATGNAAAASAASAADKTEDHQASAPAGSKGEAAGAGEGEEGEKKSKVPAATSMGALLAQMNRPRKKKKRKTGKMDQSIARLLQDAEAPSVDKKAASEAARAALAIAGKMKVQEQKHFAGQTISVVRSLDKGSAEAQQAAAKAAETAKQTELDKIVSELKNPKKSMSAVEKSSYDWDQFKEDKGIGEQLEAYAKDGYVEKQQFLQRVEERQFEAGRAERERARAIADAAAAAARNSKR